VPRGRLLGDEISSPSGVLLDTRQRRRIAVVAAVLSGLAITSKTRWLLPDVAVVCGTVALAFLATFRLWIVRVGCRARRRPDAPAPLLADAELPSYTVLVPLYREANVVERLVGYLGGLDYPVHLVEILLLCERDDVETIEVLDALSLDDRFRLVVSPPGGPRTKPRACNVGLRQATGDLCVVYDAEDRPQPDQLRVAAAAFATAPPDVVCLQARLGFHNHAHNWLTRCFTVEYGTLFDIVLPGQNEVDLPLPLGGTSNHLRTQELRQLGGWDPWNVTEDADLGLRLYRAGHRTRMLDSMTLEEACARPAAWTRQRTRWMKGYLQTWAVHTRTRAVPFRSRLAVHLVVGGNPTNAALLPAMLVALALIQTPWWPGPPSLATPLAAAALVAVASSVLAQIIVGWLAVVSLGRRDLASAVPTLPIYALMISAATYRAAWHVVRCPQRWEKTPHGLSGDDTDPAAL
jgi:cellulose synthase/poly-beta-1,6-N-acetylglucosamine synthase-like glycosyltransferase